MQDQARVVIIGSGIAGSSVAYHLTELGWRDIVVLEQGPLIKGTHGRAQAAGWFCKGCWTGCRANRRPRGSTHVPSDEPLGGRRSFVSADRWLSARSHPDRSA